MTVASTIAPFHRLGRASPDGWRPVVEVILAVALTGLFQVAWMLLFAVDVFGPGLDVLEVLSGEAMEGVDPDPVVNALTFGVLGVGTPAALIAARVVGKRWGTLLSVTHRFRWRMFGRAFAWIAVPVIAVNAVEVLVAGVPESYITGAPTEAFWWNLAVLVSLVPLQCLAEELFFRGTLPQAFGMWARSPWVAYGAAIPSFVFGHTYDVVGLAAVAVMSVVASALTHRTGGIEAAVVFHTTLNANIFFDDVSGRADLHGPRTGLVVLTAMLVYAGAAAFLIRQRDVEVREPLIPGGARVAQLPGGQLGPQGITFLGPRGPLTPLPWRGDARQASVDVDGWRFRTTIKGSIVTLRCTNLGSAKRPVWFGLAAHVRHPDAVAASGPAGMWVRPEGHGVVVTLPFDGVLAPGESAELEVEVR